MESNEEMYCYANALHVVFFLVGCRDYLPVFFAHVSQTVLTSVHTPSAKPHLHGIIYVLNTGVPARLRSVLIPV